MSEFKPPPTRISEPGVYTISDPDYLADPVVEPSLNASTIKILIAQSPKHAWAMHPRLGAAFDGQEEDGAERKSTEAQALGTAAHQMFLHGSSKIAPLNVENYQTKAARQLRDNALAAGLIPLKAERYEAVLKIVNELEYFRKSTGAFTAGKPEQTLVWQDGRHWARAKVDWLPDEPSAPLWDLKTVSTSAAAWARQANDQGADLQAAYYARGAEILRGEPPWGMKFCVIETKPPYGIMVYEFSPAALGSAQEDCYQAVQIWARCRETDTWPSYSADTQFIDTPSWKLTDREWRRHQRSDLLRPVADAEAMRLVMDTGNPGI